MRPMRRRRWRTSRPEKRWRRSPRRRRRRCGCGGGRGGRGWRPGGGRHRDHRPQGDDSVIGGGTGEEAVTFFRRHADRVDLLLTDVVMPGMGGIELASEIAASKPEIRVLFMSGYSEELAERPPPPDTF